MTYGDVACVLCSRCGEPVIWNGDDSRPTCGCDELPDGYNFPTQEQFDEHHADDAAVSGGNE